MSGSPDMFPMPGRENGGGSDLLGGNDGEEIRGLSCDFKSLFCVSVITESFSLTSFVLYKHVNHFSARPLSLALTLVF